MVEQASSGTVSDEPKPPPPPPPPLFRSITLVQSTEKKKQKHVKVVRIIRSVVRSFPIVTPACRIPNIPISLAESRRHGTGTRVTGTLFGYRKGRVSLSIQESSRCLPMLVIELAMQTHVLQKELASGMLRIALECERRPDRDKVKLLDELTWTMYCNGKKNGFGVKRKASDVDLNVMEILKPVSMGAGVLPGKSETEGPDGEMAYMRAYFDRVVGSKDSETLYMLSPEENCGPELSIFFVRL